MGVINSLWRHLTSGAQKSVRRSNSVVHRAVARTSANERARNAPDHHAQTRSSRKKTTSHISSSPLFLPKHTLNMDRSPPPQIEMTWIFLLSHSLSRITLPVCLWINFASFFHYTTAMLPFLKLNKGQNSTTRSQNDMNTLSIESAHVHYPTMFLILFCGLFSPPDFILATSFASKKMKKVIFSTTPNFR